MSEMLKSAKLPKNFPEKNHANHNNNKISFSVGTKLTLSLSILLIASIVLVTFAAAWTYKTGLTASIQKWNDEVASSLATQTREYLSDVIEKMKIIGLVQINEPRTGQLAKPDGLSSVIVNELLNKNSNDLLAVFLHELHPNNNTIILAVRPALSQAMLAMNDPTGDTALNNLLANKYFSYMKVSRGDVQVTALRLRDNSWAVALAIPFIKSQGNPAEFSYSLTAIESLTKGFGTDILVSRAVYDKVSSEFVFEPCERAQVKGKSPGKGEEYCFRGF